ncbi:DUF3833 domain-containing protein [Henriciella litoralis]|uniref:DUF3833 domain-containing protein n=1 Tax=Henriciella litoralis TaxID=568102 RepID=UPI000A054DF5|nr:DUF3833 domain-containing protein [Henriciella litoralis]
MKLSMLFAPAAITLAVSTTGCVSASLDDFSQAEQTLRLENYFEGETKAYGIFEDRFGKVRRQFDVDITGTVDGNTLTLVEEFDYYDGEQDTRTWTIEILGDGRYRGTANDVPDMAEGRAVGNAFNWKYKVDLKVGDDTWNVGFDDWMYLLQDDVMINRAYVTRYGIRIGQVTIAFQK